MAEKFPELSKYINPQMQYAQNIPKGRINISNQHHTDDMQCVYTWTHHSKMQNAKY